MRVPSPPTPRCRQVRSGDEDTSTARQKLATRRKETHLSRNEEGRRDASRREERIVSSATCDTQGNPGGVRVSAFECAYICVRAHARWRRRRVRTPVDGMRTGRWRLFLECGSPINPGLSRDVTGSSSWQQGRRVNYLQFRGSSLSLSLPLSIPPSFLSSFPTDLSSVLRSTSSSYPPGFLPAIFTDERRNRLEVTVLRIPHASR